MTKVYIVVSDNSSPDQPDVRNLAARLSRADAELFVADLEAQDAQIRAVYPAIYRFYLDRLEQFSLPELPTAPHGPVTSRPADVLRWRTETDLWTAARADALEARARGFEVFYKELRADVLECARVLGISPEAASLFIYTRVLDLPPHRSAIHMYLDAEWSRGLYFIEELDLL